MQKLYRLQRKIIAYIMISLMVVNLFWVPRREKVNAEGTEEALTSSTVTVQTLEQEVDGKKVYSCSVKADAACKGVISGTKEYLDGTKDDVEIEFELEDADSEFVEEFTDDGLYDLQIKAENLLGEEAIVEGDNSLQFIVDNEAPVLGISGIETGGYSNKDVVLKFTADDWNLSSEGESYTLTKIENGNQSESKELKWEKDDTGYHAEASLTLSEQGTYTFELSMKDENGIETKDEEIKKISFIIDKISPEIMNVEVCNASDGNLNKKDDISYLNGDARIAFSVKESNSSGTTIATTTLCNGKTVNNKNYDMGNENPYTDTQTYSEEGDYTFYINVKDQAGNETDNSSKECRFIIDKTAPVVKIKTAVNDDFERQFVITAKDKNNDLNSYVIEIEKTTKDNRKVIEEIKNVSELWTISGDTATYVLDCTEEANYYIAVKGFDKAGNESNHAAASYNIDTTKPVITQSSTLKSGDYYNMPVELKGTIQELNYMTAKASIEVLRTFEGKTYTDINDEIELANEVQGFQYKFDAEGEYQVRVKANDKAGNEADELTLHFVIDKTAPELSILGVSNNYKTKTNVDITFQSVDRNHNFKEYGIISVRTNSDGEEEVTTDTEWPDHSSMEKDQMSIMTNRILSYEKEGNYEITFKGQDKTGNVSLEKKAAFSIDRTAPVISKIGYSDVNGLIMEKYGIIFSNNAILVEFDVSDSVVGVDENRVYVTIGEERTGDTPIYIAHKTAGNRYYVVIPTDLSVEEFDDAVTIWANDLLGNESHVVSTEVVYNTDYPNIVMECDEDYSVWTNKDVTFHTNVSDSKSGLKEVIYRIDGEEVERVVFNSFVSSYDYDLVATKSCDKISGYKVSVEVINNAGSTNTMSKQVFIDKKKPKVTLSGVEYNAHFNQNQTFVTEVKDVSYSNTKTVYVIKRTLDGKTYNVPVQVFHSKQYNDRCKRTMKLEGLYKIYAIATDSAGNQSISNTLSFVIDKTAPKLSVSGTEKGSMNGAPVILQFACEESFFATNMVSIDVVRKLDDNTVKEKIKGFPQNAKKTFKKHTFSEDGTYEVTISAVDKAGNVAASKSITFSIDRTKPEIHITGTGNYEQWDRPVTVSFSITESYFTGSTVQITGTKTDIDGNVSEIAISNFRYTGKVSSLSRLFDEDGIYALEIVSRDEAGNRESAKIHFVIDQTPPEINKVSDLNGEYYQEFKLTDSLEEIFKDLTVLNYHLLLNGVEYSGTDVIDEEGKYNLYVDAEDELGHVTSKNVEFIVDHTAPKIIFNGVEDGETVHESGEVLLSLTNSEDEITAVRMNGIDYGAAVRRLTFTEYGSYKIEVDCKDKAGNSITRSIYFVYNNPVVMVLLFGGIGILIIAMCAWLIIQTRKKQTKGIKDESSSL